MTSPGAESPLARREALADHIHGQEVVDPYRWLEAADSAETSLWIKRQQEIYADNMYHNPYRDVFLDQLLNFSGSGNITAPVWRGDRAFYMRRRGRGERGSLYWFSEGNNEDILLVDQSDNSRDERILERWQPSRDGMLLAYQMSLKGSEASRIWVKDVESGLQIDGPIEWCRYSPVVWLHDASGFYYVRRLPSRGKAARQIMHHTIGQPCATDSVVFPPHGASENGAEMRYGISLCQIGRASCRERV